MQSGAAGSNREIRPIGQMGPIWNLGQSGKWVQSGNRANRANGVNLEIHPIGIHEQLGHQKREVYTSCDGRTMGSKAERD